MKIAPVGLVPLERALSKLGFCSRSTGRGWILSGRTRVNGKICVDPFFTVNLKSVVIEIDDLIKHQVEMQAYAFNKPRGVVTTHRDEKGRPTIFSLLTTLNTHLIAVGRLDFATSGLLILTNDTQFSEWLTNPKNEVLRTYIATVRGLFTPEKKQILEHGLRSHGEHLHAEEIVIRKSSNRETHVTVYLREGKNREIRRLFAALGHEVTALKRISYGSLQLGDLEVGKFRKIGDADFALLYPAAARK